MAPSPRFLGAVLGCTTAWDGHGIRFLRSHSLAFRAYTGAAPPCRLFEILYCTADPGSRSSTSTLSSVRSACGNRMAEAAEDDCMICLERPRAYGLLENCGHQFCYDVGPRPDGNVGVTPVLIGSV